MTFKKYFFLGMMILLFSNPSIAQIYAQGKNLNNGNIFSIKVVLEPKPMDPGNYHALVQFYGQRKDVKWYLKEGVEHKAFANDEALIDYMAGHGWIYLKTNTKNIQKQEEARRQHFFRKSMNQLSRQFSEQANVKRSNQ